MDNQLIAAFCWSNLPILLFIWLSPSTSGIHFMVDHHIYLMLRVATHCYTRNVHKNETLATNIWPENKIYLFEPYQYKANTLAMHNSVQMVFRRSLAVSLGLVTPPAVQHTQIYGETNLVTAVESHDADTYVHIRAEQYCCFYYCNSSLGNICDIW